MVAGAVVLVIFIEIFLWFLFVVGPSSLLKYFLSYLKLLTYISLFWHRQQTNMLRLKPCFSIHFNSFWFWNAWVVHQFKLVTEINVFLSKFTVNSMCTQHFFYVFKITWIPILVKLSLNLIFIVTSMESWNNFGWYSHCFWGYVWFVVASFVVVWVYLNVHFRRYVSFCYGVEGFFFYMSL